MQNTYPPIPPVSLAVAAEILRDTPARLNDIISKGIYPCAPSTTSGKKRVFDEIDILGLRVFTHLSGSNTCSNQREAGKMACSVVGWMRTPAPANSVLHRMLFPTNWSYASGIPIYKTTDGKLVGRDGLSILEEEEYGGRSATTVYVSLNLEDIRFIFREKIEKGSLVMISDEIVELANTSAQEYEA